jgi:hypothetical protein
MTIMKYIMFKEEKNPYITWKTMIIKKTRCNSYLKKKKKTNAITYKHNIFYNS